jgi:siroheme synthase (precorrin-2 oxidase/ferrochelatase)
MTTYIKRVTMVPITTSLEYEGAIKDELLYLEDITDTIQDITVAIDNKDEDVEMYEETKELRKIIQEIDDVRFNLTKLVEDYTTKLADAIPGTGD